jgi:hypothetical protein
MNIVSEILACLKDHKWFSAEDILYVLDRKVPGSCEKPEIFIFLDNKAYPIHHIKERIGTAIKNEELKTTLRGDAEMVARKDLVAWINKTWGRSKNKAAINDAKTKIDKLIRTLKIANPEMTAKKIAKHPDLKVCLSQLDILYAETTLIKKIIPNAIHGLKNVRGRPSVQKATQ